jgi:hypothetical protein
MIRHKLFTDKWITMRYWYFLSILLFGSCSSLGTLLQHDRSDGIYRVRVGNGSPEKLYVAFTPDTITLYPLSATKQPDLLRARTINVPENALVANTDRYRFAKTSIDLDLTTILFKYRPAETDLPAQLNSQFNFAVYSGYRRDYFSVSYRQDPLKMSRREYRHWGFDAGLFLGMGTTPVNGWVTRQAVETEYDGLAVQTGLAAFIGMNNLAAGLCLGIDYLTDKNRNHWIYQKKPWIGLAIGLALN